MGAALAVGARFSLFFRCLPPSNVCNNDGIFLCKSMKRLDGRAIQLVPIHNTPLPQTKKCDFSLLNINAQSTEPASATIICGTGGVMSQAIPDKYRDLFSKKAFASLGTLMPDGRPQVTPVWVDLDGDLIVINSAKGRQKDRNLRRDPRVSLAIIDPDNPYRYLELRGRVVEITEQGAAEHIDKMAKKYLGVDKYPYKNPDEVRVMYKIQPDHATMMG
jgi:PPOX class probable F420-dependent enzyme